MKHIRGLPQRSSACATCSGLGCAECGYKGRISDSVQGRITDFLTATFEAEGCNFVWLGSEDENSLVTGAGRPFYAEVLKPKRRFALKEKFGKKKCATKRQTVFFRSKEIQIRDLEILERRVTDVPQFEIATKVNLIRKPDAPTLEKSQMDLLEKSFSNVFASIRLSRKFRTVQKEIRNITCRKSEDGNLLELTINCDGGIPLKKFVSGQDDTVRPNLGAFLASYEIDREKPFDILGVKIKENAAASQPRNRGTSGSALNDTEYLD